ncbi:MAG TPA: thioredoxin domain-containing protein [Candidatus Sulfopaludibacter sp.]|jgi:protein-disulfide isomerase|nr:thioredoxin domain-containing protein [Candidatus Sulfopaludibacter sp.]
MKKFFRYAPLAALPLLLMLPLTAQEKDPGITRDQADAILNELRQIRQLLEKQGGSANAKPQGPAHATLNMEGAQMLGSKDAPITMVEFTDYQCPFCQRFHTTVFHDLKKNFIDTGKVRFYSRDLPLDTMHPNAIRAAMAARCAGDQGQFWKIRDMMGANPDKLDMASIMADAASLGMNTDTFKSCVESDKYKQLIQNDVLEAMKIGADGTPTFVIGKSTPNGVDGEVLIGAQPYVAFEQKLKEIGAK